MTRDPHRLRITTYNTHKCRGFDGRIKPERIISVIHEFETDILCLQEVVNSPDSLPIWNQAEEIARSLPGYSWTFGANRALHGGTYGSMTLTRLPIVNWRNHNIARRGREERGVLQTAIEIAPGRVLHVFNVHLGTGFMERRYQAKLLVGRDILSQDELTGIRVVVGDFNEWTHGLTSKLLRTHFQSFRPRHAWQYPRTFPGMLPIFSLDHFYYESPLELESSRLWRSRRALIASDHLPLIADFVVTS